MSNILTIGLVSEGTTDQRFLPNIIKRTFEELSFDCKGEIDVYDIEIIEKKGIGFVNHVLNASKDYSWINILCVHSDSDNESDKNVLINKINPTLEKVKNLDENENCKNIVFVVPIQMTESWMLSDTNLLIEEIGTTKTIEDLDLPININSIEQISNPKQKIIECISTALLEQSSRRRNSIKISDLYLPISQKISLDKLKNLSSYNKFRNNCIKSLKKLDYL
ncbi:MAG: DUF4276 family protein [Cyanobacteriota bacterium]